MREDGALSLAEESQAGLLSTLVGDGRPLLGLFAAGLIVSGLFALFLSATVTFLPQDIAFLGMDPKALCALHQCRIVHFLFHDRVSFGGTLIAVGILYLWLIAFPLKRGEEWGWWTLALSSTIGFASFLCCLIYKYLDTWHATASLALLPLYVFGLWCTRSLLPAPRSGIRSLWQTDVPLRLKTKEGFGRFCLLFVGAGMVLAGCVIMILGSTIVFVPQDITYFGFTPAQLNAINPRLIPLIAHDRAGFGGGLAATGLCVFFVMRNARLSRALWQAVLLAGLVGFGCAIGIHYPMGYVSASHLAPAWTGALIYIVGVVCTRPASQKVPAGDPVLMAEVE